MAALRRNYANRARRNILGVALVSATAGAVAAGGIYLVVVQERERPSH